MWKTHSKLWALSDMDPTLPSSEFSVSKLQTFLSHDHPCERTDSRIKSTSRSSSRLPHCDAHADEDGHVWYECAPIPEYDLTVNELIIPNHLLFLKSGGEEPTGPAGKLDCFPRS